MSRFFVDFDTAYNEIKRDLAEMGLKVHPHSMQDKVIAADEGYGTLELQNYSYTILDAVKCMNKIPATQPWAGEEFLERLTPSVNPGRAYLLRKEVWKEFLHDGKFAYTYSERMYYNYNKILHEARFNPDSRQLFLPIFGGSDLDNLGGISRIPCSLGYLFQIRNGKAHITYLMRSCDLATHFANDVYLAIRLLDNFAKTLGYESGDFNHYIASLHVYQKDVKGIF